MKDLINAYNAMSKVEIKVTIFGTLLGLSIFFVFLAIVILVFLALDYGGLQWKEDKKVIIILSIVILMGIAFIIIFSILSYKVYYNELVPLTIDYKKKYFEYITNGVL